MTDLTPIRRIDTDDDDGLDDLVIFGEFIQMLHIERVSHRTCWGRVYMKDGSDVVLTWTAGKKGRLSISVGED